MRVSVCAPACVCVHVFDCVYVCASCDSYLKYLHRHRKGPLGTLPLAVLRWACLALAQGRTPGISRNTLRVFLDVLEGRTGGGFGPHNKNPYRPTLPLYGGGGATSSHSLTYGAETP